MIDVDPHRIHFIYKQMVISIYLGNQFRPRYLTNDLIQMHRVVQYCPMELSKGKQLTLFKHCMFFFVIEKDFSLTWKALKFMRKARLMSRMFFKILTFSLLSRTSWVGTLTIVILSLGWGCTPSQSYLWTCREFERKYFQICNSNVMACTVSRAI